MSTSTGPVEYVHPTSLSSVGTRYNKYNRHPDAVNMASPIWIPELLEQILLKVDMTTLLKLQYVCHFWQNLITGSKAIQQDLFLRPIELRPGMQLEPRFNPLLHEMQRRTTPEKGNAFLRKEASWRRMLIRRPPTFKLGVITPGRPRPFLVQSFRVRNDGLRLGLLFALVEGDVLRWDRMGAWTFAEICSRLLLDAHGDDVGLKEHLLRIEECDVAFYMNFIDTESYKDGLRGYFDRHETKKLEESYGDGTLHGGHGYIMIFTYM